MQALTRTGLMCNIVHMFRRCSIRDRRVGARFAAQFAGRPPTSSRSDRKEMIGAPVTRQRRRTHVSRAGRKPARRGCTMVWLRGLLRRLRAYGREQELSVALGHPHGRPVVHLALEDHVR